MSKYIWIGISCLFIIVGVALWWRLSDPVWAGTAATAALLALAKALWPGLKGLLKPKDFTPEQLSDIRRGKNPFDKRPPGAGGRNGR